MSNANVNIFFGPLAVCIIGASVTQFMASRKTLKVNPWLTLVTASTVFFGLYFSAWLSTWQTHEIIPNYYWWSSLYRGKVEDIQAIIMSDFAHDREHDTFHTRSFLIINTSVFLLSFILAFQRIWFDRKLCGVSLSMLRLLPLLGIGFLYIRVFIFVLGFVSWMLFNI